MNSPQPLEGLLRSAKFAGPLSPFGRCALHNLPPNLKAWDGPHGSHNLGVALGQSPPTPRGPCPALVPTKAGLHVRTTAVLLGGPPIALGWGALGRRAPTLTELR